MSKQNHRVESQAEKKPAEPKPVEMQGAGNEMIPGPETLLSGGRMDSQAALLRRVGPGQRQEMAQRINRMQGNHHVQRLVEIANRPVIQAKLGVSQPGDAYEQEADRVADQVMRMGPALATPPGEGGGNGRPRVQRIGLQSDDNGGLQTSEAMAGRIQQLRGGGAPLPDGERDFFESRLGVDLGRVRVHTGSEAESTAKDLQARAYTVGSDVVFNRGEYQPGSENGRRLMAHELAHVVQQGGAAPLPERWKANGARTEDLKGAAALQLKGLPGRASEVVQLKPLDEAAPNKTNRCMAPQCQATEALLKATSSSQAKSNSAHLSTAPFERALRPAAVPSGLPLRQDFGPAVRFGAKPAAEPAKTGGRMQSGKEGAVGEIDADGPSAGLKKEAPVGAATIPGKGHEKEQLPGKDSSVIPQIEPPIADPQPGKAAGNLGPAAVDKKRPKAEVTKQKADMPEAKKDQVQSGVGPGAAAKSSKTKPGEPADEMEAAAKEVKAGMPDFRSMPLSEAWEAARHHIVKVEDAARGRVQAGKEKAAVEAPAEKEKGGAEVQAQSAVKAEPTEKAASDEKAVEKPSEMLKAAADAIPVGAPLMDKVPAGAAESKAATDAVQSAGLKIQRAPIQVQRGLEDLIPDWAKSALKAAKKDANAKKADLAGQGGSKGSEMAAGASAKGAEVKNAAKTKAGELKAAQESKKAELQAAGTTKKSELQADETARRGAVEADGKAQKTALDSETQAMEAEMQAVSQAQGTGLEAAGAEKAADLQAAGTTKEAELQAAGTAKGNELQAESAAQGAQLEAESKASGAALQAESQAKGAELQNKAEQAKGEATEREKSAIEKAGFAVDKLKKAADASKSVAERGWFQLQSDAEGTVQKLDEQADQLCSQFQGEANELLANLDPVAADAQKQWKELQEKAQKSWNDFLTVAQPALGAISEKWGQFSSWLGTIVWEPLQKKAGELAVTTAQLTTQAWLGIEMLWKGVTGDSTTLMNLIQGRADAERARIAEKAGAAHKVVNGKAEAAQGWIDGQSTAAQGWIAGKAGEARNWIGGKADAARGFIGEKADAARTFIGGKADEARGFISGKSLEAQGWINGQAEAARGWITGKTADASTWIQGKVIGAQTWIQNKVTAATSAFRSVGHRLVSGMGTLARGAARSMSSKGGSIRKWFGGILSGLVSKVESAGNSAVNKVSNALGLGLGFVGSAASSAIGTVGQAGNSAVQQIGTQGAQVTTLVQAGADLAVKGVETASNATVTLVQNGAEGAVTMTQAAAETSVTAVQHVAQGQVTLVEAHASTAVKLVGGAASNSVKWVQGQANLAVDGFEAMNQAAISFNEFQGKSAVQGLRMVWSGLQADWNLFMGVMGPVFQWVGDEAVRLGNQINTTIIQPTMSRVQGQWAALQQSISDKFPGLVACWNTFKEFMAAGWEKIQKFPLIKEAAQAVNELIEGAVLGDFVDKPNVWNIIGQVASGFIPYFGQAADVRDLIAAIQHVAQGKDGAGLDLMLSLIAVVPGLGDAVKGGKKLDKVNEVVDAMTTISKDMEKAIAASDEVFKPVVKYGEEGFEAVGDAVKRGGEPVVDALKKNGEATVAAIMVEAKGGRPHKVESPDPAGLPGKDNLNGKDPVQAGGGMTATQARLVQLNARKNDLQFKMQQINRQRGKLSEEAQKLLASGAQEAELARIQQIDRQLELEMVRLETQHKAVEQELAAIRRLLDKNIEGSFKIFG